MYLVNLKQPIVVKLKYAGTEIRANVPMISFFGEKIQQQSDEWEQWRIHSIPAVSDTFYAIVVDIRSDLICAQQTVA